MDREKMLTSKPRKFVLLLVLALSALAYASAFADLETNFWWKSCLVLLPIQVGASGWFLWLYWSGRLSGTARQQKARQERFKSE